MVVNLPLLNLAQRLRTSSNELQIPKVNVEHVRARVGAPQLPISVERVERRRSGEALRGDGLDDVAFDDVFLEGGDEGLVPFLADVGGGYLVGYDRGLMGQRHARSEHSLPQLPQRFRRFLVQAVDLGGGGRRREEDVRDQLEGLEQVVKDNERLLEHED